VIEFAAGQRGREQEECADARLPQRPTPPSWNVKTARSWRGIVPFTHLAREGRMTVIIGRRDLLAALGGAAAAWPLAAPPAGDAGDRVSPTKCP
jgi:hypothetical protein